MRVLLDENLDHALRKLLGRHDVVTVTYMGWAELVAVRFSWEQVTRAFEKILEAAPHA